MIKAKPDTLALVAIATALTFALSYVIHAKPEARLAQVPAMPPVQQAWAGGLADLAPSDSTSAAEPLTSASLVVPKSVLALPSVTVRPLVRLRGCEGSVCAPAKTSAPPSLRRPSVAADASLPPRQVAHRDKAGLIARLNPLKHLPDMAAIGKPFAYAGNTVTGWLRSF